LPEERRLNLLLDEEGRFAKANRLSSLSASAISASNRIASCVFGVPAF
jgi:hypothetical protein